MELVEYLNIRNMRINLLILTLFLSVNTFGQVFINNPYFEVEFDTVNKVPIFTAYILTRGKVNKHVIERYSHFWSSDTMGINMAHNNDYSNSGWDQGHLIPADDMRWNSTAERLCFCYLNIAPQFPEMNRVAWRNLENNVRQLAIKYDSILIITRVEFSDDKYNYIPQYDSEELAIELSVAVERGDPEPQNDSEELAIPNYKKMRYMGQDSIAVPDYFEKDYYIYSLHKWYQCKIPNQKIDNKFTDYLIPLTLLKGDQGFNQILK
jgi:DNA/RNA endonuclease G (NUC1)